MINSPNHNAYDPFQVFVHEQHSTEQAEAQEIDADNIEYTNLTKKDEGTESVDQGIAEVDQGIAEVDQGAAEQVTGHKEAKVGTVSIKVGESDKQIAQTLAQDPSAKLREHCVRQDATQRFETQQTILNNASAGIRANQAQIDKAYLANGMRIDQSMNAKHLKLKNKMDKIKTNLDTKSTQLKTNYENFSQNRIIFSNSNLKLCDISNADERQLLLNYKNTAIFHQENGKRYVKFADEKARKAVLGNNFVDKDGKVMKLTDENTLLMSSEEIKSLRREIKKISELEAEIEKLNSEYEQAQAEFLKEWTKKEEETNREQKDIRFGEQQRASKPSIDHYAENIKPSETPKKIHSTETQNKENPVQPGIVKPLEEQNRIKQDAQNRHDWLGHKEKTQNAQAQENKDDIEKKEKKRDIRNKENEVSDTKE